MRADTKYYNHFFAGLWLLVAFAIQALVPESPNKIFYFVGVYATIGLAATLFAVCLSPLARVVRHPLVVSLLLNRRYIGLWGYAFVVTHLVLVYGNLLGGSLAVLWQPEGFMLLLGLAAFTILTALACTSTDAMVRHLGGQNWKRLHSLVCLAIALAVVHAFNLGTVVFDGTWSKWALVGLVVLVALFKAKHQFKFF